MTAARVAKHHRADDSGNGLFYMYATFDHQTLLPGSMTCQCACVVVAKKSKKQSLI